jgi:HD-GYP domain-containing protein (c-di-GMP phosphodiesterase class II)
LLIEDSEADALMLLQQLRKYGFVPEAERVDGSEELERALLQAWDLIIADYALPGFSALEALAIVQETTPETPFILVSGVADDAVGTDLMHAGARDYINKGNLARLPLVIQREVTRIHEQLEQAEQQAQPQPCMPEFSRFAMNQLVNAWSLTAEKATPTFIGHQRRVAQLAVAIGRELQYSRDQLHALSIAGLLHDVGKSWLPREIWEHSGMLNDSEWEIVQKHPETSYIILRTIPFPWNIAEVVLQHHERIDGSGYPYHLTGDDIRRDAKILAVADTMEALTSPRRHRPAFDLTIALTTVELASGIQYDQEIVAICRKVIEKDNFAFS